MELHLKPGKYIVAVSGGVDSMVLLDVLSKLPDLSLIVAHFDHGIRPDSSDDRQLVKHAADMYGLPFIYKEGHLDANTSEEVARNARYDFLREAQRRFQTQAIITAHHQDDVLETMLINLIRGTGRHGLSSLRSTFELLRPLLDIPKATLMTYAHEHAIKWHDDSTNATDVYLRNYLRSHIIPKMSTLQRQQLLDINAHSIENNAAIDDDITMVMKQLITTEGLLRSAFIQLPHAVSREIMAAWLRMEVVQNIDRKQIERLVVALKTSRAGTTYDIDKRRIMNISRKFAKITQRDTRKTSA